MLQELQMHNRPPSMLASVYCWFLRLMAAICIVSALVYWSQLLGITGDNQWRFDAVAPRWRIVSTVLAIVLPAAGLGLWLTQAWGIVLWIIAVGVEIAVFGVWSEQYLARPTLVTVHGLSLGVFVVIATLRFFQKRKQDAAQR